MRAINAMTLGGLLAIVPPSMTGCEQSGNKQCETWYEDLDDDFAGNPEVPVIVCPMLFGIPEYASWYNDDCDDTDPEILPGAPERCNGKDDDCDGVIDNGEDLEQNTYYPDADADGWGDPNLAITACAAPEGYVTTGGDCDDTDSTVSRDDC